MKSDYHWIAKNQKVRKHFPKFKYVDDRLIDQASIHQTNDLYSITYRPAKKIPLKAMAALRIALRTAAMTVMPAEFGAADGKAETNKKQNKRQHIFPI